MKNFIKENYVAILAAGYGCSLLTFVAMLQEHELSNGGEIGIVSIGAIAMLVLTLIISLVVDGKVRWQSLVACLVGCATVYAAVALGVWFNVLSA